MGKNTKWFLTKTFFSDLNKIGIKFDDKDKKYLTDLLVPLYGNYIDIKVLE